ncbi:NodB homology domain-containing protein [Plasmodiophora brassicae]
MVLAMTIVTMLLMAVAMAYGSVCHGAPRLDRKCGPWVGGAGCPPGSCCSQHGWCGTSSDYCNDQSICQSIAPACSASPRPDNRCGPVVADAGCPAGQCCSSDGWCGSSPAYCNERSVCPALPVPKPVANVSVTVGDISVFNWCGPVPWIAVTFDDSAFLEPQLTSLLSDLERLDIRATFFICPSCYRGDVPFCLQLQRVIDAGHTVQSHSMTHSDFKAMKMDENAMTAEINEVTNYLETHCGLDIAMSMFRPPYGELLHSQARYVNSMGYTIASWTVDSMDWTGATLPEIQSVITKTSRKLWPNMSMVIGFHDAHYTTPGARGILDWLVQAYAGHEFVTVEKCFANCLTTGTCQAPDDTGWPGIFDGAFDET